jgi:DNA-binding GntR family transcriptional regulator
MAGRTMPPTRGNHGPAGNHMQARDRRPLYLQAVEAIQGLVSDKRLGPGDRLPSEVELASLFGVGRSTIREAMGHLELVRVVERRRGVGTVLIAGDSDSPAAVGLETLESLEALALRQGWVCGTSNLAIRPARAGQEQAQRLGLPPGSPVSIITRTKSRDGVPIAEMVSVVPERIIPFAALDREIATSITELMTRRHSPPVRLARAEVTAVACEPPLARRLRLEPGRPVLVLDELFLGDGGIVLAWNLLYFVPESIRLEVIRRPRPLRTGHRASGDEVRRDLDPVSPKGG